MRLCVHSGATRLRFGFGIGTDGSKNRVYPSPRPFGQNDELLGVLHFQRLGLWRRQRPSTQEESHRLGQADLQLRRRRDGLERLSGELCHR